MSMFVTCDDSYLAWHMVHKVVSVLEFFKSVSGDGGISPFYYDTLCLQGKLVEIFRDE